MAAAIALLLAAVCEGAPALPEAPRVWTPAAPIPQRVARYAHAQCLGENRFYVISGVTTSGIRTQAVYRYDAVANAWTALANIPVAAEGPAGVCYQGRIYVAGGVPSVTSLQIYDISSGAWSTGAALPRAAAMAAMGAYRGRIYVIGGDSDLSPGNGVSGEVNVYDVASNAWLANGASMPRAASSPGFAQIGSFVYVVGGWDLASPTSNVDATQRYDMATGNWQLGPPFTTARADFPLAASATALYAIGGDVNGGGFFDLAAFAERLALSAWPGGGWTFVDSLPTPRSGHKGGFCTRSFFPGAGEVWSTAGVTNPAPTFTTTNQYLAAEACPTVINPVALAVDAGGNGVLEPGETAAVVAPTWRNVGEASIPALTGVASNFTGPSGPAYTIDDGAASYGTVAVGATASCTATGDCYAVSVSGARPAVHWDGTVDEDLSVGVSRTWTLHVGASFTDVSTSNPFYRFIETLVHNNVTGGCAATTYCPGTPTSREQMAVFVLIARERAGYSPPACAPPNLFSDVPETSPFCRFVEELANRGVVTGCGPAVYCPTDPVTREQMAVFVLRTLDPTLNPPACVAGSEMFADVPASSAFCRWVEELARRGVVTGCGGGSYCPAQPVTREQMGVFLSATFGLTLYGT